MPESITGIANSVSLPAQIQKGINEPPTMLDTLDETLLSGILLSGNSGDRGNFIDWAT